MARPCEDTMQICFRVPKEWPREFEKLAKHLAASRHGMPVSRTQAMREAMMAGLMALMGHQ